MSTPRAASVMSIIRRLGPFWTYANALSLCRAVLAIPITYLVYVGGPTSWLLGLIVVAAITDWFDGRLARWSHTVSDWGKVLDPLADKVMAVAVTGALVFRPIEPTLPLWFAALVLARDATIIIGGVLVAKRTNQVVMSIWAGKVAVTALAVTVVAALLRADPPVMQACIWITTALLVYSLGLYVIRGLRVRREGVLPAEASLDGEDERAVASIQREPDAVK